MGGEWSFDMHIMKDPKCANMAFDPRYDYNYQPRVVFEFRCHALVMVDDVVFRQLTRQNVQAAKSEIKDVDLSGLVVMLGYLD